MKGFPRRGMQCTHEHYPETADEVAEFDDVGMHMYPDELVARMAQDSGEDQETIIQRLQQLAVEEMYGGNAEAFWRTPAPDEFTNWLRNLGQVATGQDVSPKLEESIKLEADDPDAHT